MKKRENGKYKLINFLMDHPFSKVLLRIQKCTPMVHLKKSDQAGASSNKSFSVDRRVKS